MSEYKVYMLPKYMNGNKYIELLVDSLEAKGVQVEHFSKKKIGTIKKGDVLHFHWPSFHYRGSNILITGIKTAAFLLSLFFLRMKGIKVVWTVHNLWPHSTGRNKFDKVVRTILSSLCTKQIVMGNAVKSELVNLFNANEQKVVLIPHGHYKDVYKSKGINVRAKFGIPEDAYVYAFFGQISPYKGIDRLLKSFAEVSDKQTHLLIAGRNSADFDVSVFENLADNVHVSLGYIEDNELVDYIKIVDSIILPYKDITTSGTAILALSYSKPVVAPDIGLLREYLGSGCAVLYDAGDDDGLRKAMLEVREKREKFRDSNAFNEKLKELDWSRISDLTLRAYKSAY